MAVTCGHGQPVSSACMPPAPATVGLTRHNEAGARAIKVMGQCLGRDASERQGLRLLAQKPATPRLSLRFWAPRDVSRPKRFRRISERSCGSVSDRERVARCGRRWASTKAHINRSGGSALGSTTTPRMLLARRPCGVSSPTYAGRGCHPGLDRNGGGPPAPGFWPRSCNVVLVLGYV